MLQLCHHEYEQPDYTNQGFHIVITTTIIIKDSMNITSREITSGWANGRNPQNIFLTAASHHSIPIHINNNTISIIIIVIIIIIMNIISCLISNVIITINIEMLTASSSLILHSISFLILEITGLIWLYVAPSG